MQWRYHFLVNLFLGIIILRFLGIYSQEALIWIVFSGFLIDIDHLVRYFWEGNKFSVKSYIEHQNKHTKDKIHKFLAFHTFEFMLILAYMAFFHPVFLYVFIGGMLHLVFDMATYYKYHRRIKEFKYWSIVWHISNFVVK